MAEQTIEFLRLVEIVRTLRDPEKGCPWDIKQNHQTLIPYLIEEAYEVIDALNADNDSEVIEELGDLLLQILLHSQIADESGRFSIIKVLEVASEKLIRRHPHVFGEVKLDSVEAVLENWEKIKSAEGKVKQKQGVLSGVPASLPALLKADRMGAKAARIGLDWNDAKSVLPKIQEELEEFVSAHQEQESGEANSKMREEFGDLMFTLVQYARKYELDAEQCLQEACNKFAKRVQFVEAAASSQTTPVSAEQLDLLWQQAKLQAY